jgi:hypothetical protein
MRRDCIEDSWFLILQEVVQPVALLGRFVVDQWIGKAFFMSGIPEHVAVGQKAGFNTFNVIPLVNIVPPPSTLEIVFELYAQGTIIVCSLKSAVDFRAGEDEPATLAEGDDLI